MLPAIPLRRFAFALGGGAALACLAIGCGGAPATTAEEESEPAPVKLVNAKQIKLAGWVELPGATQPLPGRVARVSSVVEGRVVSVLADKDDQGNPVVEGGPVKKGQILVRLDDSVLLANRAKLVEQEKQAGFAQELANVEVKRLEGLTAASASDRGSPLVSQIELQKARIALEDAKSKAKGVKEELKALDAQHAYYTLRAPISGRLGRLQVTLGPLAVGTTVAEVIDLSRIDVLCHAPPAIARHLAEKQKARLSPDAEPTGEVAFLAVQAEPETGTFAVKVRFQNPGAKLRANAVQSVEVQIEPEKERWTVPEAALLEDQYPPVVVIAEREKDGEKSVKARRLLATVGVRDRRQGLVEILGLKELPEEEKGKEEKDKEEKDKEEKEKKKPVPAVKDAQFVIEGAHGLQDGDVLKVEK